MQSVQSSISMQLSSQVILVVVSVVIQIQRAVSFMKTVVLQHQMCTLNLRNNLHFGFDKHFKRGLSKNICWHRHCYCGIIISFIIELLTTTTTMMSKMQVIMMGKFGLAFFLIYYFCIDECV